MKEKENISSVRQRLEPSSELKSRVMERAAGLEAGRKTFGGEKTTTENREIQKEQIQMNANRTKETARVKSRFPVAVISAAACAALVIGIASISMKGSKVEPLNDSKAQPTSSEQETVNDSSASSEDPTDTHRGGCGIDSTDELTVTYDTGNIFSHDNRYIPDIDAMVKKIMQCPVLHGAKVPAERTIEYYVDGEKQLIELSDEKHPVRGSDYSAGTDKDLFLIVTVNGTQYGIDYNDPTLLLDLKGCTGSSTSMSYEKKNGRRIVTPYDDTAETKASELLADIRKNGTLLSDNGSLPTSDCDLSFHFDEYLKYRDIRVWEDAGIFEIKTYGFCGDEPHSAVYGSARRWIDELNELVGTLDENTDPSKWIDPYYYGGRDVMGYIRIQGLTNADGVQYVNTPVTQYLDNEYYLNNDWTGGYAESGNIFADCAEPINSDIRPQNITLYGKSRRDLGSMFTHLIDYNDGTGDKLSDASVIKFALAWDEGLSQYPIIGVGIVDTRSADCFNCSSFLSFDGSHSFDSWIKGIKDTCSIIRDIDCSAEDEYLTLSTAIDDENAGRYRFVVFARKLRKGETFPAGGFSAVRDSLIETKPIEEVRIPDILNMNEEQAAAVLKEAGLDSTAEYVFSNEVKGTVLGSYAPYYLPDCKITPEGELVSKGAKIKMLVSGGTDDLSLLNGYSDQNGETVAISVPLPEGLSGYISFSAFVYDTEYSFGDSVKEISGRKEIVLPVQGTGKKKVGIAAYGLCYMVSSSYTTRSVDYATYEVDFDAHTCTLIGELNTEGLLKVNN